MAQATVDVGQLVDGQKIGRLSYVLLGVAFLVTVIDGYDIFVPGFIAPELIKAWHFPPQELGPMFSISLLGIIIGAAAFGHVGDKFGRRRAIVWSSLLYGVLSLASLWTTNLSEFTLLRFFIGLGIGGAIPNAIALVAELTPARARTAFLLLVMVGAPTGQLLPGLVTVQFVPTQGWHILLIVGGVGPILIAALAQWLMPESIKYLTLHPSRRPQLVKLARRMQPDLAVSADTRFLISEPPIKSGWSPAALFSHRLAVITPLIWLCLGCGLLAVYFTSSWLPSVLQGTGLSTQQAAGRMVFLSLGGIVGALLMAPMMARFGLVALITVFLISVPLVASIGLSGLSTSLISFLTAAAGFCIIAIVNGVECVMGRIYLTAIRAKGAGWGLAVGRLVALVGPVLGGMLVGMHLSNFQLFLAPAICLAIGTVGAVCLAILCTRRFGARQFEDAVTDGSVLPTPSHTGAR